MLIEARHIPLTCTETVSRSDRMEHTSVGTDLAHGWADPIIGPSDYPDTVRVLGILPERACLTGRGETDAVR